MALIQTSIADNVGTITLSYQIKCNALSEVLISEISAALREFAEQSVRAEPGAKVWAGHNVDELPEGGHDPLRMVIRDIESFPAPVIALLEGGVWGGACELVFACDMIIAAPDASFAATPAKLGVPYNASACSPSSTRRAWPSRKSNWRVRPRRKSSRKSSACANSRPETRRPQESC